VETIGQVNTHFRIVVSEGCLKLNKFAVFGQSGTQDQVVLSVYKTPKYETGQYETHPLKVLFVYL